MKLVEILAKELKEWADTTVCYAQDRSGEVLPFVTKPDIIRQGMWEPKTGEGYIDQNFLADVVHHDFLADDYQTAIVTKEMWEIEKAKLNAQNTDVFAPIHCRDRIKEIDTLVESLEEERVSLVQALEDEGFALISTVLVDAVPTEDMNDWRNWRVGDNLLTVGEGGGFDFVGEVVKLLATDKYGAEVATSSEPDYGWYFTSGEVKTDLKFHSRPQ